MTFESTTVSTPDKLSTSKNFFSSRLWTSGSLPALLSPQNQQLLWQTNVWSKKYLLAFWSSLIWQKYWFSLELLSFCLMLESALGAVTPLRQQRHFEKLVCQFHTVKPLPHIPHSLSSISQTNPHKTLGYWKVSDQRSTKFLEESKHDNFERISKICVANSSRSQVPNKTTSLASISWLLLLSTWTLHKHPSNTHASPPKLHTQAKENIL